MIDFDKLVDTVPSLGTKRHAQIIYGLIRWLQPTKVLEIGAYCGYTTAHIAKAMKDTGLRQESMLCIIDNFSLGKIKPSQICNVLTMLGVNDVPYYLIEEDSQTLTNWPSIDLAVIDGDHSYKGCQSDFRNCVNAGATCIVIHDTVDWSGPRHLIENLHSMIYDGIAYPDDDSSEFTGWDVIEANHDCGLAICLKREPKVPASYEEAKKDVN